MPDYITKIIILLAGVGVFMVAMKMTSDSMERISSNRLRKMLNKVSGKALPGIGIGTGVTAIIQSSSATTVMVVGLVNAGIMNLLQATYIIMGANIGTTVTAQIAQLQNYKATEILMLLAFIGVMIIIFSKNDNKRSLGTFIAGLGLIFVGLWVMSYAVAGLKDGKFFTETITQINNPFILLGFGIIFTAIVQSSSAVTGILVAFVSTGVAIGSAGSNAVLFIVLGSNIGTCVTAMLASVGTNANARRASLIHLMFNVIGTTMFMVFLLIYRNFTNDVLSRMFSQPATQLAMFHTFFNVVTTLMLMPFAKVLVKLSKVIIHDDKTSREMKLMHIDERLLTTPAIAIDQLINEVLRLARCAQKVLSLSVDSFLKIDTSHSDEVKGESTTAAYLVNECTKFLIQLNKCDMSDSDEVMSSSMHHIIADFERVCDLGENIMRYTADARKNDLQFSTAVYDEIVPMHQNINKLFDLVCEDLSQRKFNNRGEILRIEDDVDSMRNKNVQAHIERMNEGVCNVESGGVYVNTLNNLERAADHLVFIENYPKKK